MKEADIIDRTIFVGGPPRSGTTFATKSLNQHPSIVAAIDDHVFENWGLYYYRDRVGLVQDLRTNQTNTEQVKKNLEHYLFTEHHLIGAAPSEKTRHNSQLAKINTHYAPTIRSTSDEHLGRFEIPLEHFAEDWQLCLKSPEISFVLPQLAQCFPESRFVLVYRPIYEIAESMFRLGHTVKTFPVFHQRWRLERDSIGLFIPPPGVPAEWYVLWQDASAFKRCVLYAASYIRAIVDGVQQLDNNRYFIYNHAALRDQPEAVFSRLAQFLGVDSRGFLSAGQQLNSEEPTLHAQLMEEYTAIETELNLKPLIEKLQTLMVNPLAKN